MLLRIKKFGRKFSRNDGVDEDGNKLDMPFNVGLGTVTNLVWSLVGFSLV